MVKFKLFLPQWRAKSTWLNQINVTSDSGAMAEAITKNLAVAAGEAPGGKGFGY